MFNHPIADFKELKVTEDNYCLRPLEKEQKVEAKSLPFAMFNISRTITLPSVRVTWFLKYNEAVEKNDNKVIMYR